MKGRVGFGAPVGLPTGALAWCDGGFSGELGVVGVTTVGVEYWSWAAVGEPAFEPAAEAWAASTPSAASAPAAASASSRTETMERAVREGREDSNSTGPGTSASVPAAFENNHARASALGEPVSDSAGVAGAEQQRGLADYLRILRRRKWYVIGTTILVTGLAVAFSLREHKVYQAQSQVLLSRQDIAAAITGTPDPALAEDPARYAQTQAAIARSGAVARLAIARAGIRGRTPAGLLAASSVTPDATADVLDFSVQDRDPTAAARLVNAYTAAFVTYEQQLQTNALARARQQIVRQLARLAALGFRNSPAYQRLANSAQQLHTMQLLQSQDTVLSQPRTGVQIKPTPTRDALLGVGFGILIGLALAFVAEALDRRVRSADEIEEELGLPLLGRIPPLPRRQRDGGVAMLDDPSSPYAEAIRRLATTIVFANPDRPRVLLFTSALQQEGKSTTLANLAVALAAVGNRVVLVDLDLRRPALASFFGLYRLTGLTDVAVGRQPLETALVPIELPSLEADEATRRPEALQRGSLHLLPAGPRPASPGEFVASAALGSRVLAPLRGRADFVLLDSPPVCAVGDALRLSERVDAVVAVERLGLASRSALRDLQRQLAGAAAPALGVVAAGVTLPALDGYAQYLQHATYFARSRNGTQDASLPSRRTPA